MGEPAAGTVRFASDLRSVEEFLLNEADLLDSRRFEEWSELFTEDGVYWAPTEVDQQDPLHTVSLIFDDRDAMRTRIARIRHPNAYFQIPQTRTSRIVTNVVILERPPDRERITSRSKFMLHEYRPTVAGDHERILSGTYFHELVVTDGGFKIARKKAVLTNCEASFESIVIYF